jgi:metal-responsive CopG/Arc/MetJ family transcriptional regulator
MNHDKHHDESQEDRWLHVKLPPDLATAVAEAVSADPETTRSSIARQALRSYLFDRAD